MDLNATVAVEASAYNEGTGSATIYCSFKPAVSSKYLFEYDNLDTLTIFMGEEEITTGHGFLLADLIADNKYMIVMVVPHNETSNLVVKEYEETRIDELYSDDFKAKLSSIWGDIFYTLFGMNEFRLEVSFSKVSRVGDAGEILVKYFGFIDDILDIRPSIIEVISSDPGDIATVIAFFNDELGEDIDIMSYSALVGVENEQIIALNFLSFDFLLTAYEDVSLDVTETAYYTSDGKTLIRFVDYETTLFTIPDGVETIGYGSFILHMNLAEIVIPTSVVKIEQLALDLNSIGTIYYCGDETAWGAMVIERQEPDLANEEFFGNIDIYFYSETENADGHHWRWVGDSPTIWE